MHSTYPIISKFTPAILAAVCKQQGMTADELRLGTLKTVECTLDDLLKNALTELHADDRATLEYLHRQARLAIGDE